MGQQRTVSDSPAASLPKDVVQEKPTIEPPPASRQGTQSTTDDSKALSIVQSEKNEDKKEALAGAVTEDKEKLSKSGSADRDAILAKVKMEKRMALIKAWEENEKAKSENKYFKAVSNITAWENTKKSSVETRLRKKEEKWEKKKAAYVEKMKNEIAVIHRKAEERKAMAEAKRGEEMINAEESAAKFRSAGEVPRKLFVCFGA
eukprot:TRINITY_DN7303_c0_g1_i1.p1 TRINITY_DN7303_c0_g1~~TRINITY_DN7303_c0_g1_i1.p1  ORF type:complete len:204 (-),score=71.83 TRINITY_DN7303_c0_g1_i1:326-937(-)